MRFLKHALTLAMLVMATPAFAGDYGYEQPFLNITGTNQLTGTTLSGGTISGTTSIGAGATITSPTITGATITTSTITDAIQNGNMTSTGTLTATSNTTLANITGLSYTATAAGTYNFHIHLTGVSGASGGLKVAFAGTATATSFTSTCWDYNGTTLNAVTTQTTLGSSMIANTASYSDLVCDGAIVVNAGGSLALQAAQNASNATSTTVLPNSSMTFGRTS